MSDTIVAICTPLAPSGIGVIRLSGKNAFTIADKVFKSSQKIEDISGYSALYGKVFDKDGVFDNVVALKFVSPHSYTGEDTVEFSCHGSVYILKRLLYALINSGARLAEGGEFTRTAFLNGKLDLTSAESVMQLVSANSKQANAMALSGVNGALYKQTEKIRNILTDVLAEITAWVDFPDEGVANVENDVLLCSLNKAYALLSEVIATSQNGMLISNGIKTAIIGKPNVGKSTLMNLLSKEQRSIVTDIAGTTRDVIEETVNLGDVTLRLADTAGIRSTDDIIEKIGVDMSQKKIDWADLVLAVFDLSRKLDEDDKKILSLIENKKHLVILNKSDLQNAFSPDDIKGEKLIISAKTGDTKEICEKISSICGLADFNPDAPIISNIRQLNCAITSQKALYDAIETLKSGMPLDAVNVCLDESLSALLEMTGQKASEVVIDKVFENFCVGK